MAMIYRTDGAWGSGKGTNLAPAEVDGNFYELDARVGYIEDNPVDAVVPIAIGIEGSLFTMDLSDGTTIGPIVMTMPVPQWRGAWASGVNYQEMDFFTAPDGGFGAVLRGHTSTLPFSWAALDPDSGLPLYQEIVGGSGTTAALGDLVDVAISGSADSDFLVYNFAAAMWENESRANVAALLPPFGGDAGSGGTQGMVPAPAAGDAAAGKVLGAGGHWIVPVSGSGGSSSLAGLSDVTISSPVNQSLLQFFASDGKWHNVALASIGGTVTQVNSGTGLAGGPITSTGTLSLATIPALNLLANISATAAAAPAAVGLSLLMDAVIGTGRGNLMRRDATQWTTLVPGTPGLFLKSNGPGADLTWDSPSGAGTVTQVNSGAGLTGGPITSTGTLALAAIADKTLLANVSGGSAAPSSTTLSLLIDTVLGTVQGSVIYRSGTAWVALAPGTAGQVLTTGGSGANPSWAGSAGGARITIGDAPPLSPSAGDAWFDSTTCQLFIYYTDPNSSQWIIANSGGGASAKYVIGFSFTGGVLAASQLLGLHRVSKAITIPANFGSYLGHMSQAGATANATGSTVISVDRALSASPNTFSQIGTITIAAGGIVPTFATSGGAAVSVAQGDVIRLVGPATADATLANFYCTLVAQET